MYENNFVANLYALFLITGFTYAHPSHLTASTNPGPFHGQLLKFSESNHDQMTAAQFLFLLLLYIQ